MVVNRENIRSAMAQKCLNGTDLMKKAGISSLTLQRIWKGEKVQIKTVGKLAQAPGVEQDYLVQAEKPAEKSEEDRTALLMGFATLSEKQKELADQGLTVAATVVQRELDKIQQQLG